MKRCSKPGCQILRLLIKMKIFAFLAVLCFGTGNVVPDASNYLPKKTNVPMNDWSNAFASSLTKTGTTIVGLCCKDGVVLGADTRSTGGPLIMDKDKLKIHNLAPRIYSCAAGTSADCDHLTRQAKAELALLLIENELSGEYGTLNSIPSAVYSITKSLWKHGGESRKPSAVFLIGGVDTKGAKLYQIDSDAFPVRIAFGALGSGSTDAIALLETACRGLEREESSGLEYIDVSVEKGIDIVRKAVQAGILNDLGSGSHVDLCVITPDNVQRWRERLMRTCESDRDSAVAANKAATTPAVGSSSSLSVNDISSWGKLVWSKRIPISKLVHGQVVSEEVDSFNHQLPIDIETI
jgi:20S proteasome subunit beta 2